MAKYDFDYYAWLPAYGDFDQDHITIEADSEMEAWERFAERVRFVKYAECTRQAQQPTDEAGRPMTY